jgi:hypothetical protein
MLIMFELVKTHRYERAPPAGGMPLAGGAGGATLDLLTTTSFHFLARLLRLRRAAECGRRGTRIRNRPRLAAARTRRTSTARR